MLIHIHFRSIQLMGKFSTLFLIMLLLSCKGSVPQYNGYIDADLTYLSSNYPGRLVALMVHRGDAVHKNQLLFKLEQTSEKYSVGMTQFNKKNLRAQRAEVISQIRYDEINLQRNLTMKKQNAASQNDLDLAKKDLDVLKDKLQAIDFQIKSSLVDIANKDWQVMRKQGKATDEGIIFDTYFTKNEYVQGGQPVLSLLTQNHIKVIFFIGEKALSRIHLNDKVAISSDGIPQLATGTINYISKIAQYTPPNIYSRENRAELVFRIEARIDHPNLNQLHLGQPISLVVLQ